MRSPLKLLLQITDTRLVYVLATFLITGVSSPVYAAVANPRISPSLGSPQPLGTTIELTASATDSDPGPLSYKWEVMAPGSLAFSTLEDFDQSNTFSWTPNYTEGIYRVRMTARDYLAGTSAQVTGSFRIEPLITGSQPVAIATANPLVALFSAPTCPAGSTMTVVFQLAGSLQQTVTDSRRCHAGSQNFYIGGMMAGRTYTMFSQVTTGAAVVNGPSVAFTTGTIPSDLQFPAFSVTAPAKTGADTNSNVALWDYTLKPYLPTATDIDANILWYNTTSMQMARPLPGGTFVGFPDGFGTGTGFWGPDITRQQFIREFDLAGNIVHETNCARVYEQLQALGLTDPLGGFNHDAVRLADGDTIAIGDVQRIFPAGTQGSAGSIDIIGAIVIVLDQNFQVLSYWNSFDHACAAAGCLDINRAGDYTCRVGAATGITALGCPQKLLLPTANDWLHMNSIQYLTADGDLLASLRNQDWIVKIDYNGGAGTGQIVWRLGAHGDFKLRSLAGLLYPWFSGQHNPSFIDGKETTLVVFDNGNTRHLLYGGNSRGQVWNIDQSTLTASLQLNADLGVYSPALGSAQVMLNGNYNFLAGDIGLGGINFETQSTEVSPQGVVEYQVQGTPTKGYRVWRLPSLYESTLNGSGGPE
jgi:arylsulfate sulfotransferase